MSTNTLLWDISCTYICYPLNKFKLLIINDILYYPSSTQNMFPIFTYDSIHAWRRNSVDYIIKFLTTSPIFLMGGLSNSIIIKRSYLSSWLLCTSRDIQSSYIITSCNVSPSTFIVFQCANIFSSFPFL